ncbi:MAG: Type IV pilus biogenesis and competence protein PilQ precursor [Candidatus Accumulibacter adjunctus]|uniref:Type IV pilus biogenesis and competence protein PilQ n=1 Tax=Candidatus Accumulibacter adjunctus TaxID=1454001 RepID=A0A011MID5_9PROT|nr:MAG: Type IV pilus biogenesis and competence protein PilQ precursor [Candidatus Accumulibacter adjunctus]
MKRIKHWLPGLMGALSLLVGVATAQEAAPNAIESMNVMQQGAVVNVKLTFKDPLQALPSAFSVAKPARIALDFPNTVNASGKSSHTFNEGDLKSANIVQAEGRTRVVLNLNRAMSHEASIEGRSLLLAMVPAAKPDSTQAVEHFARVSSGEVGNSIRDVTFRRGKDGEGRITVDLTDPNAGIDIRHEGKNLVVDFVRVNLPPTLRKKLDVTDFGTPVLTVNTIQKGADTRMTITPRGLWEHNAYQSDTQFVIEVKPIIEDPNKLVQGSRGGYRGEKLSLNFQNVDVRRLLQVIGEFTGMNMVISDSVGGSITLILKDVPWDQALDIIMQQKGLDMRKSGNVILIAPREEIATREKLEFESRAQIGDLEPLQTESFQVNYIRAEALQRLLIDPKQTLLSKRGSALVDERSNMMFVKDTPGRLDEVRAMIAKVDVPPRQVMIEARIVEAGDTFSKSLGVRLLWDQMDRAGARRIGGDSTLIRGNLNTSGSIADSSVVNLPAIGLQGNPPGSFALQLFNSALTQFLTVEISALEADGRGKTISSPRVTTANGVEAIIEQGTEIPYQQATSSGATAVAFKKAVLSLKVKPSITPDGRIAMEVDVNKDRPLLLTGGAVPIDTKHVKTEVLVENGGTVVIGGIYEQRVDTTTARVPFLGDLPYIGFLFRNRTTVDEKKELLIFITPRIVTEHLSLR